MRSRRVAVVALAVAILSIAMNRSADLLDPLARRLFTTEERTIACSDGRVVARVELRDYGALGYSKIVTIATPDGRDVTRVFDSKNFEVAWASNDRLAIRSRDSTASDAGRFESGWTYDVGGREVTVLIDRPER